MLAAILGCGVVSAADEGGRQVSPSGIKHSFLLVGPKTALFNEDSEIVWEVPGNAHDGYVLPNGNILVSDYKVSREYKAGTHDVVWSYELSPENKEMGTPQRLDNGLTMLVERGLKPRIIEVDAAGKIVHETPLQPDTDDIHMQTRMARKLPNGNYLVPHLFAFAVKEYSPAGEVVDIIRTDLEEFGGREGKNWPFTAIRLDNGNTYVNLTHGDKTAEFGPDGKVVWRLDNSDVDGRLSDPCGAQRLPNGNTIVCSYGQRDPSKCRIFEVTRDKEVVWEFFHPELHAHEVHIVTTNGETVTPVLR
ncbi:MAG: hypothetical protein GC168_15015 [Candidatus Hydrogenedens sp.]|nr:hypothetical protein [Candidatus Hydrogenedens sp.]